MHPESGKMLKSDDSELDVASVLETGIRKNTTTTALFDISADDDLTLTAIDMRPYAQMIIRMPAAWTAASIGFKVAEAADGTFLPLYDDDGNLVQIDSPSVSQAYVAPAPLGAGHFVKLWSQNGSGTNVAQGDDRTLGIDLKA